MFLNRWHLLYHHWSGKKSSYPELLDKINDLEKDISSLKKRVESDQTGSPIIIENIHIENFKVDKIDHENNFGALGIKELAGQLNIGANYRMTPPASGGEKKGTQHSHEGPLCNIRAKR